MLTFELRPGRSVGPFELGLPICEAVAVVSAHADTLRQVEIKYSESDPVRQEIIMNFPSYGFHLRFESEKQCLRMVEVYDVTRLQLRFAASLIGGTTSSASFVNLYECFGPTYAGKYDVSKGMYALEYPGLLFEFPIPDKYAEVCLNNPSELPLEFPDGTTPVAARMCVFAGAFKDNVQDGVLVSQAVPRNLSYFEEVRVSLGECLKFAGGAVIAFGDSPQDVWTQLGAPGESFFKEPGAKLLHARDDAAENRDASADYFYNYFNRGLDVLFDGTTHCAKKFVLHSNAVGHADFNVYVKCNFVVEVPDEFHSTEEYSDDDDFERDDFAAPAGAPGAEHLKGLITPQSSFDEVKSLLGDAGRATIHTHFTPGSSSNPFGSSYIYGFPQKITFEVLKSGYIANVTVFS